MIAVALGPDPTAVFPAVSLAVPAAMEMPRVPSPVIPERVTVQLVPLPAMAMFVWVAEPVLLTVTWAGASVDDAKWRSE